MKISSLKRPLIAVLASVCAFSSVGVLSASATTTTYSHSVTVSTSANAGYSLSVSNGAYVYDLFASYPTVYSGSSSTVRSILTVGSYSSGYKYTTLQKDSSATHTASYGTVTSSTGSGSIVYDLYSGYASKSTVTTSVRK